MAEIENATTVRLNDQDIREAIEQWAIRAACASESAVAEVDISRIDGRVMVYEAVAVIREKD